jgi:hypothetical protein
MERYLRGQGYDVWEFNNKEIDRDLVRQRAEMMGFEGFIGCQIPLLTWVNLRTPLRSI